MVIISMRTKTKKAGTAITVVNICVISLCVVLTVLLLIPTVYHTVSTEEKPIFGRYLYVNTNNSLAPVMQVNDIIAVVPTPLEEMVEGDFLCYYPIGEQENGVQFGKLIRKEEQTLSLSDKQGHYVDLSIGDIVTVGRATDKILFLGQVVHFLKSGTNRVAFYIALFAVVAALLALTVALHIKQQKLNRKIAVAAVKPKRYSLDELIEVETEPIEFEIAERKEEYIR